MSVAAPQDPFRRLLGTCIARGRTPGAAWWVERGDGLAHHGVLGAAVVTPERVGAVTGTPWDLASLTKSLVTGTLLALLEQRGVLEPERPAATWLPALRGSAYAEVSLLDLALHRARLAAWRPLYLEADSVEGYLERIAATPPAVRRGERLYSDLGYILLGAAIEAATGRGLARLFAEEVAAPLALERAGFPGTAPLDDAAATERGNAYERELAGAAGKGFRWRTHVLRGEVHDGNAHGVGGVAGHAGLFAPLEDVARLARALVRPSALGLSAQARARLFEEPPGGGGRTVGFELARVAPAARGVLAPALPGHTGFTGTSLWLDPAAGGFAVLLTNRVHPTVDRRGFQPVRRAFHRLAAPRLRGDGRRAPGPA